MPFISHVPFAQRKLGTNGKAMSYNNEVFKLAKPSRKYIGGGKSIRPNVMIYSSVVKLTGLIVVLMFLLVLSGCGTNLMEFYFEDLFGSGKEIESTPEHLIWNGLQAIQDKDYGDAQKAFRKIIEQYPYSKYVVLAELKLADAYFLDEKYSEAAVAYEQFARLHPSHPVVPYVLYQLGLCYFEMSGSIDRDHEQLLKALGVFNRISQVYPGTIWAEKAKQKAQECRHRLAQYELYVAKFYMRRGKYLAAKKRLERALSEYLAELNSIGKLNEVEKLLRKCNKEVEKGVNRPSVWSKLGF